MTTQEEHDVQAVASTHYDQIVAQALAGKTPTVHAIISSISAEPLLATDDDRYNCCVIMHELARHAADVHYHNSSEGDGNQPINLDELNLSMKLTQIQLKLGDTSRKLRRRVTRPHNNRFCRMLQRMH